MTIKRLVKSKFKEICTGEVNGKSLKLITKLIKPCIPIKVGYNSTYSKDHYFYSLIHMGLTNGSAESTGTLLNMKFKIPSPDSVLRHCRFSLPQLEITKENIMYAILEYAKKFNAFKQPIDIAIDPFDDPYYGDKNDIHVIGSKPKDGTTWFHSFTHLDAIIKGERFGIDFEKRILGSKDSKIVENLLKRALETVSIRIAMLDREFYQVDIVNILYRYNLKFIIPAPDTSKVKKLKKLYKDKLPIVVPYTMTSSTGEQVSVKLALVKRGDNIHAFITNLNWDAERIAEHYRNRWGIETNNRKRNEFRPLTTSKDYRLRYLYHLLSTILHNIWILVNLMITFMIYKMPYDPIITVKILKEFLIDDIKSSLLPIAF